MKKAKRLGKTSKARNKECAPKVTGSGEDKQQTRTQDNVNGKTPRRQAMCNQRQILAASHVSKEANNTNR